MTIRSGGRPRDGRATQARPYDPDAYATETVPEFSEPVPRGRDGRGGGSGGGLPGFLKFLIFALVLAAIVLAVALTALRPMVSGAIMGIAEDNPAALQVPFVRDIVAENLGTALTAPASADPSQVEFLVESGDTARSIATRLEAQGFLADSRAFVFIAIDRNLTGALQQGTFILRKNLTPDQLVSALLAPPKVPYVDIALRTGLRLEQITAKLETLTRSRWTPPSSTRSSSHRPPSCSTTIPGSRRSSRTPRRAPRSRGSCGRRPTGCSPTRHPRSWSG